MHVPFNEEVLRPRVDRFHRDGLVVQARKHHHRHTGGVSVQPVERSDPLTVRQRQIQQNHVELRLGQRLYARREIPSALEPEQFTFALCERLPDQEGIRRTVLDEQNSDPFRLPAGSCRGYGHRDVLLHAVCSHGWPPRHRPATETPLHAQSRGARGRRDQVIPTAASQSSARSPRCSSRP